MNSPPYTFPPLHHPPKLSPQTTQRIVWPRSLPHLPSWNICVYIYVCVDISKNCFTTIFISFPSKFWWSLLPLLHPLVPFLGSSPPNLWPIGLLELSTITSVFFTVPVLISSCWEPQAMFTLCLYPLPPPALARTVLPHANTYCLSTFRPWVCRLMTYVFGEEHCVLANWIVCLQHPLC